MAIVKIISSIFNVTFIGLCRFYFVEKSIGIVKIKV